MIEFKVKLDEAFVQAHGYLEIEKALQDFAFQLTFKFAAREILEELETIDLTNDAEWQAARNLAWQQEKHHYLIS